MANINCRFTTSETFPSGQAITTTYTKSLPDTFRIAPNFTLKELANNLASESVKALWNDDIKKHCRMIQALRDRTGVMNVSSWYRTPSFNRKCGGASNSLHLKALATDVKYPKMNDGQRKIITDTWRAICAEYGVIGGINYYTNGVHLASREDLFGAKSFVIRDYRGKNGDW